MKKRENMVKHRHSLSPMTSGILGAAAANFFKPKVEFFEFTEAHKLGFLLGSLDVCKECKTKIKKMVNNDL